MTTVANRVDEVMKEYGVGFNELSRAAGVGGGYFSRLFARSAKTGRAAPRPDTIQQITDAFAKLAADRGKPAIEYNWLATGTLPKYRAALRPFGESKSYLEAEAVALQTPEGRKIPRVAYRIARKRIPAVEKVYDAEEVLAVVRYHYGQSTDAEIRQEETSMREEEEREVHKVSPIRPIPTPPPPKRKGPAVRSVQSRKR
jgi:hypothetical protein